MNPERAHQVVFGTLRLLGPVARTIAGWAYGPPDARLATHVAGLKMAGPIGLAAGLDKNGELARFWPQVGFGAVELGTVTAHAQPGNPKPRLFRFPERQALINRMGFNNHGSEVLAKHLEGLSLPVPCGINLGKSKITPLESAVDDYAASARRVQGIADYLVINVSSPNTPGLRSLQDAAFLRDIVAAVTAEAGGKPVLVKLAPDLEDEALREAVTVAEETGSAGIIATNTTIARHGIPDVGPGGLSGGPLHPRAVTVVERVAEYTELPIIGVGGIRTLDHVLRMLAAGADSVQIYSALVFHGPGLVHRLNQQLVARMKREGIASFDEFKASLRTV
jgi:dihydroorotate dehydrogenase